MRKNNRIQDERVVGQRRKIASDAFWIVFYGLIISVFIQQYVFDATFSQYAVEVIIFIIAGLYMVVRNILVGNDLFDNKASGQKLVVINSLVSGIIVGALTGTLNTFRYGYEQMGGIYSIALASLISFVSVSLFTFAIFELFYIMNKKRQNKLDEKYGDKDE